jgi:hypothetical protein
MFNYILELFHLMGIFIAKSLQDQRLVDKPFSMLFLKVLCLYTETLNSVNEGDSEEEVEDLARNHDKTKFITK